MNNFPRDRYNSDEFLTLFDRAGMQDVQGDFFKSIKANDEELEIYFPNKNGKVENKHIERAKSILSQIRVLDNQVQESCEAEYEKSDFHVRNFMQYLVII